MSAPSLRIAVFHDLPSGGAKRALYQQVKGLVGTGHEVTAYVPSTADEEFLPLAEVATRVRMFPRQPQPNRERALEGGPSPLIALEWLRYLGLVRRSEREIAARIDAGGHDVVLVGASQFSQAPWLLRWLRTPSVYYCQEPLRAAYEPRIATPATRLALRATLGRVDRKNCRSAAVVAVNSRYSAERSEAIYRRPVQVNYLGVDFDRFRQLPGPRDEALLTVAALHPLKGLDFLLDALGEVPPEKRLPLRVVSDRAREAERRRLEQRARSRGVELQFCLRVDEEELVRLYNRARLVVYAPYNEPFGFVPLEAMACGRPVLGVREGGIPETIQEGETGFLAERDTGRFAARICQVLDNPEEAERMARSAAAAVRQRWSWERSVEELARLCSSIARRPTPASSRERVSVP